MSDVIGRGVIEVEVNDAGVDAGIAKIERSVANLGKVASAAGKDAAAGIDKIGAGGDQVAGKVDRTTKNLAESIQRATAAMQAGAKGSAEYYAALGNTRGADAKALAPYLAQLKEATDRTRLAAEANKKFEESTHFLEGLKGKADGIGKTASQLAEMRAAQLGVSDAAAPMIAKLKEAEKAASGAGSSFGSMAGYAKAALVGFASFATVSTIVNQFSDSIDRLDKIDDLSQKLSINAKTLQELGYAGKLSNISLDDMATGFKKLQSGMLEATTGGKEQAAVFKAMGISLTDASGNLRAAEDVMGDIADVFAGLENGATKTALAIKLFGRSGTEMVPFLNEGRAGIKGLTDEANKFGAVMNDQALKAAANFNDNIDRLKTLSQAAANSLTANLVPALNNVMERFIEASKRSDSFLEQMKIAAGITFGRGIGQSYGDQIREVNQEIENLKTSRNPLSLFGDSIDKDVRKLETYKKALQGMQSLRVLESDNSYLDLNDRRANPASTINAKAIKTALDADAAAAAAKKQNEELERQAKLIAELSGLTGTFSEDWSRLSVMYAAGRLSVSQLTGAQAKLLAQQPAIKKAFDDSMTAAKASNDAFDDYFESLEKSRKAGEDSIKGVRLKIESIQEETALMTLSGTALRDHIVLRELEKSGLEKSGAAWAELKKQMEGALAANGAAKDSADLLKRLDAQLDPDRAQNFGNALAESFGKAGSALGQLSLAMGSYVQQQEALNKLQSELSKNKTIGSEERLKREMALSRASSQAQVNAYASMAGAAKGFFKEGTKGYKALETAEGTFRAYQLASDLVKGASAAAVAVANQAQGDPYTAFPRMAAMAAAMAALGFATGSFGGGNSGAIDVKKRQAEQGTGTVFGDAEAKSESISKALDMLRDNSGIGLEYSSQMLDALRNIESSMAGLANIILRANGITSGNSMDIFEGALSGNKGATVAGGFIGGLWGKTTQKIADSGLSIGGTVADLMAGNGVRQYADIETKKSSWFGLKKKYSNSTQFADIDPALAQQFGLIFGGVSDALAAAAGPLKINADQVSKQVADTLINIPKISLRGLKGQELQDALNAVVSGAADSLSQKILPGFDDFKRVGEGYFETVIRVANGIDVASAALERFNVTAINYTDIINKQGDTAAEIVRQSILKQQVAGFDVERVAEQIITKTVQVPIRGRRGDDPVMTYTKTITETIPAYDRVVERLTGVGEIMQSLSGSAEDLIAVYSQLMDTQKLMKNVGISGSALTRDTIRGAGDLGALSSGLQAYFENFFSKEEQAARRKQNLSDSFSQIGLAVPASLQGFRQLVSGINTTTEAGQKLFGQLILLSSEFAGVQMAADAAIAEAQRAADAAMAEAQRAADAAMAEVKNSITGVLQGIIDKFSSAAKTLRSYLDSILLGDQSPLSADRIAALAESKFKSTYAATKSTDRETALAAMGDLQGVSQTYLQTALNASATAVDYARSVGQVMAAVENTASRAEGQGMIAQKQLDAMTSLSGTALDIKALLEQSAGLQKGQILQLPGFAVGTNFVPHDMPANIHAGERIIPAADNRELMQRLRSPSDNNAALAAEIKQLRAELQAAHIAIAKNTGDTAKILRKFDGDGMPAERDLTA
jgi:trimeric autotransporter adhesin